MPTGHDKQLPLVADADLEALTLVRIVREHKLLQGVVDVNREVEIEIDGGLRHASICVASSMLIRTMSSPLHCAAGFG